MRVIRKLSIVGQILAIIMHFSANMFWYDTDISRLVHSSNSIVHSKLLRLDVVK